MSENRNRIAVIDARKDLAELLNRAAYNNDRVVLTRRGKDVAAIVSMEDFAALELMEDQADIVDSKRVMARIRAGKETVASLDYVKRGLSIADRKVVSRRAAAKEFWGQPPNQPLSEPSWVSARGRV